MKNEQYIIDERKEIVFNLKNKGYDNSTVAKIMFNAHRSNITSFFKLHHLDFKKWLLKNS